MRTMSVLNYELIFTRLLNIVLHFFVLYIRLFRCRQTATVTIDAR